MELIRNSKVRRPGLSGRIRQLRDSRALSFALYRTRRPASSPRSACVEAGSNEEKQSDREIDRCVPPCQ